MNDHTTPDILAEEARFRPEAMTVRLLLGLSGMSQARLAAASGITQSLISMFQLGRLTPSREVLGQLARGAAWPLPFVEQMALSAIRVRAMPETLGSFRLESRAAEVGRKVAEQFEAAMVEVGRILRTDPRGTAGFSTAPPSAHDATAEDLWSRLADLDSRQRRLLIDLSPAFHSMSLSLRLAEEGERLATERPDEATEFGELARRVAAFCRGERPS